MSAKVQKYRAYYNLLIRKLFFAFALASLSALLLSTASIFLPLVKTDAQIPRIIHQTWRSRESIPKVLKLQLAIIYKHVRD